MPASEDDARKMLPSAAREAAAMAMPGSGSRCDNWCPDDCCVERTCQDTGGQHSDGLIVSCSHSSYGMLRCREGSYGMLMLYIRQDADTGQSAGSDIA